MDGIDRYIMRAAEDLVVKELNDFVLEDIHTVTIIMNDMSPEVRIEGYAPEEGADKRDYDHLKITYWKGERTVEEGY